MNEAEDLDRLRDALEAALGVDRRELGAETTLVGDLGVDSVDLLEISYEVEKRLGCEIDLEELFGVGDDDGLRRNVRLRDLVAWVRESRQA